MKNKRKVVYTCIACVTLVLIIFNGFHVLGVSKGNIEEDARKGQKIDSAWSVSKSISEDIGAMIFYDESMEHYTYSIYLNHSGFSFGYFFDYGGTNSAIADGIHGFSYKDKGTVLISMNRVKVAKIKMEGGTGMIPIELDSAKPFAFVVPADCEQFDLYDIHGNTVPISLMEVNL